MARSSRTYSESAAVSALAELKKGGKGSLDEFVWQNQERFYCIAFIATLNADVAEQITINAFCAAAQAVQQINPKQFSQNSVWEWLSEFIVNAVAAYHQQSPQGSSGPSTDPTIDGSAQMDWETTVILGTQRVKRCISSLPEEQKKAFILRHQLGLNLQQTVLVMNEHQDNVMAWLHRARVQVVKCLGRG